MTSQEVGEVSDHPCSSRVWGQEHIRRGEPPSTAPSRKKGSVISELSLLVHFSRAGNSKLGAHFQLVCSKTMVSYLFKLKKSGLTL